MNPHVSSKQRDDPIYMLQLKGNFINFKRLYQAGCFIHFCMNFERKQRMRNELHSLTYLYKLARFQAWSLTKWT